MWFSIPPKPKPQQKPLNRPLTAPQAPYRHHVFAGQRGNQVTNNPMNTYSECDLTQSTAVDIALHNYKKQNLPSVEDVLEKIRETELEKKMSALIKEFLPQTPTERLLVQQIYYHGLVNDTKNLKTALQTLLRLKQYRACTTESNRLAVIAPNWG